MSRMRVAMLLAAVVMTLTLTLAPGQASATAIMNPHPTCAGGLVGSHDLPSAVGTLFVYYSNANGGTNCLFLNGGTNCLFLQKNVNRGTATPMYVDIGFCIPSSDVCVPTRSDPPGNDPGRTANYKYYAGPLTLTGTADRCIGSSARVGNTIRHFGPFHCG